MVSPVQVQKTQSEAKERSWNLKEVSYFQNMHNDLDGEVTIQYVHIPMCLGQALYRGAKIQEIGLCLSISRNPRAQLYNVPQE